ncbi:terpene synthase family protein [Nonomuraea deserti]|uniref:terpene synthase family protein n=1 Tax=Nonomuraea deserti TaxID=1848322 RepID=UPI001404CB91|nr:terpene synthase family protein [Nonomuraea deserti]
MTDHAALDYFSIRNDLTDRLLVKSHQLAGVPEQDRSVVLAAAVGSVPEAARLLSSSTSLFPDGDSASSRLAFSCLSAAATFPRASRGQIADLGALTTILFGVDDIADGVAGAWSDRDVATLFGRLAGMVGGARPEAGGSKPMSEALHAWQAWCARFHDYAGAAVYAPSLMEHLELAGAAMARERLWATGGEPWPSYERYVDNGRLTILYHTWWLAALAICGPAPADAGHWHSIAPATDIGAECLRLANDVRTFERERSENKPNSVLILERAGLSTEAAIERVSAHIAVRNAAFDAALTRLPVVLAPLAEGQRRSVSFNGGWYMARDTHAYTVQDLARDMDTHAG